ncbi:MAG: hypothetical protein AAF617_05480 [Bacteroidota bacterium]
MILTKPKKIKYARKPSNLLIWIVTIYTALFTIAYQRYENRVARVYTTFGAYTSQLQDNVSMETLQGFINISDKQVPVEPNYFKFWTTLMSFWKNESYNFLSDDVGRLAGDKINIKLKNREKIKLNKYTASRNRQLITENAHIDANRWKLFSYTNIKKSTVTFEQSYLESLTLRSSDTVYLVKNKIDLLSLTESKVNFIGNRIQEFLAQDAVLRDQSSYGEVERKNKISNLIVHNSIIMGLSLDVDSIFNSKAFKNSTIFYKCKFSKRPSIANIKGYSFGGRTAQKRVDTYYQGDVSKISPSDIIFYKCTIDDKSISNIDSLNFQEKIYSKLDSLDFRLFEMNTAYSR